MGLGFDLLHEEGLVGKIMSHEANYQDLPDKVPEVKATPAGIICVVTWTWGNNS
jgi:hypothetical protein